MCVHRNLERKPWTSFVNTECLLMAQRVIFLFWKFRLVWISLWFSNSKVHLQLCIVTLQIVNLKDKKVTWLNCSYILATSALNFVVTEELVGGSCLGLAPVLSVPLMRLQNHRWSRDSEGHGCSLHTGQSSHSSKPAQCWLFKFQNVKRQVVQGSWVEALESHSPGRTAWKLCNLEPVVLNVSKPWLLNPKVKQTIAVTRLNDVIPVAMTQPTRPCTPDLSLRTPLIYSPGIIPLSHSTPGTLGSLRVLMPSSLALRGLSICSSAWDPHPLMSTRHSWRHPCSNAMLSENPTVAGRIVPTTQRWWHPSPWNLWIC